MREKLLLSTVVILGLMMLASHAQSPATTSAIGRYQIVISVPSAQDSSVAYRIDTLTGKTWIVARSGTAMVWSGAIPEFSPLK